MTEASTNYRFPDCMHDLAAAFHIERIDPSQVTISLPRRQWWELMNAIERKYSYGFIRFDGRGQAPTSFQYMGFTFKIADEKPAVRAVA